MIFPATTRPRVPTLGSSELFYDLSVLCCSVLCVCLAVSSDLCCVQWRCVDLVLCCVPVVFDSGRCYLPHGHQLSTAPSRGRQRAELIPTEVQFSYLWLILFPSHLPPLPPLVCLVFNLWAMWLTQTHPLAFHLFLLFHLGVSLPGPMPNTSQSRDQISFNQKNLWQKSCLLNNQCSWNYSGSVPHVFGVWPWDLSSVVFTPIWVWVLYLFLSHVQKKL